MDEILRDNSSLSSKYQNLNLREQTGEMKIFRVNEEYLSSQPRLFEGKINFVSTRSEKLPPK